MGEPHAVRSKSRVRAPNVGVEARQVDWIRTTPDAEARLGHCVERLLGLVKADLESPISVEFRKKHWRIEVLRGLRIELGRNHQDFQIATHHHDGFRPQRNSDLRLRTMLASVDWLIPWIWHHADHCPMPTWELGTRIHLIAHELRARIPDPLIHSARSSIRAALPLDPEILALSIRSNVRSVLLLGHYTRVAKHRRVLLERERLSPALLPVFECTSASRDRAYTANCRELKVLYRGLGLSRSGWHLLLRHGQNLWRPLHRSHEFDQSPADVLIEWCNTLSMLPHGSSLPPDRLALAWAQTFSACPASEEPDTAAAMARFLRAASERWHRIGVRTEQRRWSRHTLIPVQAWALSRNQHSPQPPRRAGFAWYQRQYEMRGVESVAQQLDRDYPGEPDRHFAFGALRFTRLDSRASLYRAGIVFHNCLVKAANAVGFAPSTGTHYQVSRLADGKPLALLRATENPAGWPQDVRELRGPCNAPVPTWLRRLVWQFVIRGPGVLHASPDTPTIARSSTDDPKYLP